MILDLSTFVQWVCDMEGIPEINVIYRTHSVVCRESLLWIRFRSYLILKKQLMPKFRSVFILTLAWITIGCSRYTEQEMAELARGKEVYIAQCLSCHGADGTGLGGAYPGLIHETITPDFTARAQYLIENGSDVTGGMLPVPITEKEKTEVINYIQNSWGNEATFLTHPSSKQLSKN